MGEPVSFGEYLRSVRTSASLSQEELAKRAGLSLRGISDLERGVRRTPYPATVRLIADALALGPADRQALHIAARPDLDSRRATNSPLPIPLTSLIGRTPEIEALCSRLVSGHDRLVTLTGAGGTGKTRLALEVGARLNGAFADGAVFVDLAPLTDASLVMPTIARAIGIRERTGKRLADTLAKSLAAKWMLLVVDNVEHVIAAAADIAALAAACPRVLVLATSREPLRVRGEIEVRLEPLPLPEHDSHWSIEEVAASPAVALFLERAATAAPGFSLTVDNAAHVVAICRRLDGLPLAIELAAARIRLLPPSVLLSRLERPLPLLTGGGRDLPPRQRTMRDAIAWSYDILGDDEQQLFRQLAIFSGGWTLEAAEAVCGGRDILTGLDSLVLASLVRSSALPNGAHRFAMLETVREFGLERLSSHGELADAGRRHAQYCVALARSGERDQTSAEGSAWLAGIEFEQANLRTALTWLRDRNEGHAGLRLASALGEFWRLRSRNAEGRAWLETFLAQTAADESIVGDRIVALRWAGELAGLQGDPDTANERLRESLALARATGNAQGKADALGAIGSALLQSGDVAGCIAPFMEAVALARELKPQRHLAFLLAYVAVAVGRQGDVVAAEALVAESEAVLHALGDSLSFEAALVPLVRGLLALMRHDVEGAETAFATALSLGSALDAKAFSAFAAAGLGEIDLGSGREVEAAQHFRDGLTQAWEGDYPLGIAWSLGGLARIAARRGSWPAAARLFGAVDPYRAAMQALPGPVTESQEAGAARTRDALGDAAFRAYLATGRTVALEEIIAGANALADDVNCRHG